MEKMDEVSTHISVSQENSDLLNCVLFLEEVKSYQMKSAVERIDFANSIISRFVSWDNHQISVDSMLESALLQIKCKTENDHGLKSEGSFKHKTEQDIFLAHLKIESVTNLRNNISSKKQDLFGECAVDINDFLKKIPFQNFINSMYYQRYLQWLYLERKPVNEINFDCYCLLGKGAFAEVGSVVNRSSGKMFACKTFNKQRVQKYNHFPIVLNEKGILEKVNSRFVIKLSYAFETSQDLCLVVTAMRGGDLRIHIDASKCTGFAENEARLYTAEVLMGLEHLHSLRIVHRDIKPDNILMDETGHVRISDLGLAVQIPEGTKIAGGGGTMGYMAPEVLNKEDYTFSPDYFGLGCLLYEMIEGKCAFPMNKRKISPSTDIKQLYKDALDKDEYYSRKFNTDSSDLCRSLLERTQSKRIGCIPGGYGAQDIMAHPFFSSINWQRLEGGNESPFFVPDPHVVYSKHPLDIKRFTNISNVKIDKMNRQSYEKFNTGAVSTSWQEEMIDTGVFDKLNLFGPDNTRSYDLDLNRKPEVKFKSKIDYLKFLLCGLNILLEDDTNPLQRV